MPDERCWMHGGEDVVVGRNSGNELGVCSSHGNGSRIGNGSCDDADACSRAGGRTGQRPHR
jgi:putative hemolysin